MEFMNTGLFWLTMGTVMLIMEIVVPGFVLFFFGLGAWMVALVNWIYPISLVVQLLLFSIFSALSLLIFRRFLKEKFFAAKDDDDACFAEGDTAEVIDIIKPPYTGKVSYSGTTWKALAQERIEVGEVVRIVSREGLIFRVEKM